ncbi:DUF2510 domain-containing protein [Nocardioides sp. JQ2195]|uniref:PH domain-containing protein n=1 Tax=Nocardioides sp. JQ2195 TaxID=2592334 RepID=UPI00143EEA6F|nr:DUF2510 domain-containing protein [Nocardioides sp. JQ2195]QIX27951.1 DUF2510 domain-containing protein [Nocardioides sp. JQ2195]
MVRRLPRFPAPFVDFMQTLCMGDKQAPAGWYPTEVGQERFWDGSAWTEEVRNVGSVPTHVAAGGRFKGAASVAAGRLMSRNVDVPDGTVWSAVGKPISGIGAGRYRMDANYLYFEKGALGTDSQQVPIAQVLDVDVKQTMTQKARGVFTLTVQIQRGANVERVLMEDIPDGREAQRQINESAHRARNAIQQRQNTMRYESTHPGVPAASVPPAATAPESTVAPDSIAQLKELAALKEAGILTEEEFAAKKVDILSRM